MGWKALGDTTGESKSLAKGFSFDIFPESVKFSYLVGVLAHRLDHHPIIHLDWDKITIELQSWALSKSILVSI